MASSFAAGMLEKAVPRRIRGEVIFPRRQRYYPSPPDWRDEVLYFLLVDRFSDGQERTRPLLDRRNRYAARPDATDGQGWRWDRWAESGAHRWQGGTIKGVHPSSTTSTTSASQPSGSAPSSSSAGIWTPITATASRISSTSIRVSARGAIWSSSWTPRINKASASSSTSSSIIPAPTGSIPMAWRNRPSNTSRTTTVRLVARSERRTDRRQRRGRRGRRLAGGAAGHCVLHARRQGRSRRWQPRRPARRAQADRLLHSARLRPRQSRRPHRPRRLLQVLDRADRLRRLPHRHAEARLVRGEAATSAARSRSSRRTWARPTSSWSARWPAATSRRTATSTCSDAT